MSRPSQTPFARRLQSAMRARKSRPARLWGQARLLAWGMTLGLLTLLAACKDGAKESVTRIEGRIEGLGSDTLYLYGADALYNRVDTIPTSRDAFSAKLTAVDTLICAWLRLPDGREYPLFIGPGERIRVKGSLLLEPESVDRGATVEGSADNNLAIAMAADSLSAAVDTLSPAVVDSLLAVDGTFSPAVVDSLSAVAGTSPPAVDSLSAAVDTLSPAVVKAPTSTRPLRLQVSGNRPNEELTAFFQSVDSLSALADNLFMASTDSLLVASADSLLMASADSLLIARTDSLLIAPTDSLFKAFADSLLMAHAEAFIRSHPASLASIAVLATYFVEVPNPDVDRIQAVASSMIGDIKDRPYVEDLLATFATDEKAKTGKTITNFTLTGPDGEKVSRTDYKDRYVLLHFWASYDSLSRADLATYRRIYRKEKDNKYFSMLGVSLDVDRATWQAIIKSDTLRWDQAYDPAGWCAVIVGQMGLHRLPANILLNASGHVEARDLTGDEVLAKVADITQKRQNQEQRKLKAEQDRKARQLKKK